MTKYFSALGPLFLACLLICTLPTLCRASIEINAVDSGNYRSTGVHVAANPSYFVGVINHLHYHNFFVFDLSGITETILSATLKLENPTAVTNSAATAYTLYDVTTSIGTLTTSQSAGPTGVGIYNDLGAGTSYGSVAVGGSVGVGFVEIPLNAAAIAAMNATSGLFALGGSLGVVGSSSDALFKNTSGYEFVRTLILEVEESVAPPSTGIVPEPASMFVWCGTGLLACFGATARRKP